MLLRDGAIGRLVPTTGVYGVLPANFPTGGTSPSPLANDADLPADENTQWLWVLLPALPVSGTTQATDPGGYALVGAANGVYVQAYRGLTLSPAGVIVVYETDITTTVGAGGVFPPGAGAGDLDWLFDVTDTPVGLRRARDGKEWALTTAPVEFPHDTASADLEWMFDAAGNPYGLRRARDNKEWVFPDGTITRL